MTDSPTIPLVGGAYHGKKIYDPHILLHEEDVVKVVGEAGDEYYQVRSSERAIPITRPVAEHYTIQKIINEEELV